jgi:hypothetical protein
MTPATRKISSIDYVTNRVHTYPITKEAKEKELNIIQDTMHNNEYNKYLSTTQPNERKHNKNTDRQHQKTEWAIFTHSEKETQKKIAFQTRNTIQNMVNSHPQIDIYRKRKWRVPNEMYGCPLKYIGHTG